MHLAIDFGNTRIKWAHFSERTLTDSGAFCASSLSELDALFSTYAGSNYSLSTVVKLTEDIAAMCRAHDVALISNRTPIPLKNNYKTPNTLGMDRLCSAIGGKSLFHDEPVLVIDAGTCLKFEFVSADGTYQGGNISPGMEMRFSALNHYTSQLPELNPKEVIGPVGRSTEEAIRLGVQQGMLFEIQAMIDAMLALHPNLKTVITGGDSSFFANDLKTHIFADPLLVLRGINEIYLHNS